MGRTPKKKSHRVLSGKLPIRKEFLQDPRPKTNLPASPDDNELVIPEMPDHFDAEHKRVWTRTTSLLKKWGMIKEIDAAVVEAYCTSYLLWTSTDKEIQSLLQAAKKGKKSKRSVYLTIGSTGSLMANPLIAISNKAKADTIYYAAQLGMTPAARLRIESTAGSVAVKKINVFARLKEYSH